MKLTRLAKRAILGWTPLGRSSCAVCNHNVWGFMPYRGGAKKGPALPQVLGGVGSDLDNFGCPRCGAHDRERHLLMYLRASGQLAEMRGKVVVHFAPEKHLCRFILASGPAQYVRCDLYPKSSEIRKMDMLAMDFESGSVDVLIANHVLEHVASDAQALAEVRRVLKPGGYAILQTPYCKKLHKIWEDAGIDDDAGRTQAYGQEDHVRLYGRDIFERFAAAGFQSRVRQHEDLLPKVDAYVSGINCEEPLFLFQRDMK